MSRASKTSAPRTSPKMDTLGSSQASGDGSTRSNSQDGQQTALFGLEAVPASRSRSRASGKAKQTSGIFGQIGSVLSVNVDQRLFSENR